MGLTFWRDKARGLKPLDTRSGPQGHRIEYKGDRDGFALQNGGIANPETQILPQRPMIRFMPAARHHTTGLAGNWWLDFDAYKVLSHYALNHGMTLAKAAQTLLVVPQEWSDCGQMLVVKPRVTLMAYVGRGKPVARIGGKDTSPDAARKPGTRIYDMPFGTNIEQIFIPGEEQFLPDWLRFISSHKANAGGGAIPAL